MIISFDVIWIPLVITGLAVVWAGLILFGAATLDDKPLPLSIVIAWPGLIVLGAWLVWALLT